MIKGWRKKLSLRGHAKHATVTIHPEKQKNSLDRHAAMTSKKGFTLIEVLIALVILAIALIGVITVISHSVRNISHLREKMEAHWVAMNVMSRMQTDLLQLPSNADDVQSGSEMMLQDKFYWHAGRVQGIDQQTNLVYQRVFVDVFADAGYKQSLEHLEGFVRLNYAKPITTT